MRGRRGARGGHRGSRHISPFGMWRRGWCARTRGRGRSWYARLGIGRPGLWVRRRRRLVVDKVGSNITFKARKQNTETAGTYGLHTEREKIAVVETILEGVGASEAHESHRAADVGKVAVDDFSGTLGELVHGQDGTCR